MSETNFKLQDRTAIVSGPLNSLVQALAGGFVELGSDVALLSKDALQGRRFVNNLMDVREVHQRYGRAATFEAVFTTTQEATAALSKVPEFFGGIDILVDTHLTQAFPPQEEKDLARYKELFSEGFQKAKVMTEAALNFLRGRKKGRILFLHYAPECSPLAEVAKGPVAELQDYIKTLSGQCRDFHITVNALAVGVTEDYLLNQFPKIPSIQLAKKELEKTIPQLKILSGVEISDAASFLASPAASGVNGQILRVTGGL